MTVEGPGDDVGAFSVTVEPPSGATLSAPSVPTGEEPVWEVDQSSDIDIQWTTEGIEGGTFEFALNGESSEKSSALTCEWEATSGTGTVPADMLQDMEIGDDGYFRFAVGDVTESSAGEFELFVHAFEILAEGTPTFE